MRKIVMLVAVLALLAAACGGSAGADDGVASLDNPAALDAATGDTAPVLTQEEALLAFTACMREAGVDIDDPTVDSDGNLQLARPNAGPGAGNGEGDNADREAFRTAREECGSLLEGVALGFRDGDRTEIEDQLLEYAACMRDNGYQMDDPDFTAGGQGGPGAGGGPFGDVDRDDPAFIVAQDACQDILAESGRGGGRGIGGGAPPNSDA